jgi:DNA ligase 1
MNPWNIIQALEADNSTLAKQVILKDNIDNAEFIKGATMCLDPLVTFGVKQVPTTDTIGPGVSWDDFKSLADELVNRELTGYAARDAIQTMADNSTIDQWNDWYRRILIKDLRCGTGAKLFNKVQKDTIPLFGCMLAHDGAKHEKKIAGKCFVEYKYDGVRVIAIVQNGCATLYSRNGKLLSNFPHIEEALSKTEFNGIVFDGEVMSENFQALMKQVHRKEGAQTQDAYLALFDFISIEEFHAGVSKENAGIRRHRLEALTELLDDTIRVVDATLVDLDTDNGRTQFADMNKRALDEGYEGLMVKPVDALYHCKRSHAWLKIKPFIEVTLEVVGVEEGTGKNANMLGALVVEGEDDGKFFHLNVGSGLTDDMRKDVWAVKDSAIGQLVEIRADAVTISQDNSAYSLRFPRFKTFRGFVPGEKL